MAACGRLRPEVVQVRLATSLLQLSAALSLLGPGVSSSSTGFGTYYAYAEKFYNCEPKEANDATVVQMAVTKYNVNKAHVPQTLTGNVTLLKPFTDKQWGKVRNDASSNGGWKPNALVFPFKDKACSNFRMHIPGLFRALFKTEAEDQKECFIRPGVYSVNEPVNFTFPKFPVLPYGLYRFHLTIGEGEETDACVNVDGRLAPRKHKYS